MQPHCLFDQRHVFRVMDGLQLVTPSTRPRHFKRQAPATVWKAERQGQAAAVGGGQGRRRARAPMAISEDAVSVSPPMLRTVVRLWCHEVTCTYMDTLNSTEKQDWFTGVLQQTLRTMFCGAGGDSVDATSRNQLSGFGNVAFSESLPSNMPRTRSTSRRLQRSDTSRSQKKATSSRRGARKASGATRGVGGRSSSRGLRTMTANQAEEEEDAADEFEAALLAAAQMSDANVAGGLVCVAQESLMRRGTVPFSILALVHGCVRDYVSFLPG